jgi:NAD(P)-dependent dehydrogenase (short-subunit alcohol dehydrogenase family)
MVPRRCAHVSVASVAMPADLEGRVALVTGGTRGIGAAIGRCFAAEGAIVAAGYSRDHETATAFADEVQAGGSGASVHQGNVGSADDCRRVVSEVIDAHGRLDILVNNAGLLIDRSVLKMTDEDWYRVLAVNLSGAYFLSQAALPHMIERGSGRIVNISSLAAQIGNIGQANYAASKSGLFGLTRTFAREAAAMLAKSGHLDDPEHIGLTVNAVAPGLIATEMIQHVPEGVMDKLTAQIPVRRVGRPHEVARIVNFLCADDSSYITGQVWSVNGGMEM